MGGEQIIKLYCCLFQWMHDNDGIGIEKRDPNATNMMSQSTGSRRNWIAELDNHHYYYEISVNEPCTWYMLSAPSIVITSLPGII